MNSIDALKDQLSTLETCEDLIGLGKELSELKQNFEDYLLELERIEQVNSLDARAQGEPYEPKDYTDEKNDFYTRYNILKEKRKGQISLRDTLEKENLKLKKELLDELKNIIEGEENIGVAFNAYQRIHETWKKIGDIPRDRRDEIQREYSRLLEIFFYTMRIYREIKDHDYKRNLQRKQKVLTQLQQLRNEEQDIKSIEQRLRTLQDEWEEVGPVPNEEWEAIKAKYWETIRQIYDKINAHYDAQRQVYADNIAGKKALVNEVSKLVEEAKTAQNAKVWDRLIQEVKTIQEAYKKIGPGKKSENDAVWKAFRSECDALFAIKKTFNKIQNETFSENIQRKQNLIEAMKGLLDSANSKESLAQVIQFQKDWKAIGSTGKAEPKLWSTFRGSCDAFFAQKEYDIAYKMWSELGMDQVFNADKETFEQIDKIAQEGLLATTFSFIKKTTKLIWDSKG